MKFIVKKEDILNGILDDGQISFDTDISKL